MTRFRWCTWKASCSCSLQINHGISDRQTQPSGLSRYKISIQARPWRPPSCRSNSRRAYIQMALPPEQDVASIFVAALFYGLYLTTLFHCLRWLIFADEGWKIRKKIEWTNLSITVMIWVLATISRALELSNTMVQVANETKPKPPPPPPGSIGSTTTLPWMAVVIVSSVPLGHRAVHSSHFTILIS